MKLFRSKSVVKVWAMAYALMLLIVIATNIYIINSTSSYVSKELEKTNGYFLKNINISIDSMFSEMDAVVNEIAKSGGADSFSHNNVINEKTRFEAASMVDELAEAASRHKSITQTICYFPASDIVITPQMFSESDTYCKLTQSSIDVEAEKWVGELMKKSNSFANKTIISDSGSMVSMFEVTMPQLDKARNIKYVLRFYVDCEGFSSILDNGGVIVILDGQGRQLLSSDAQEYDFTNVLFAPENAYKLRLYEKDGRHLYALYFYSMNYGYKYVYLTEENYFASSTTRILIIGIVSNIACVVCMFAIMFSMSNWNYKKIKRVLGDDSEIDDEADEYERIKLKLDSAVEKNSVLEKRLENQFSMVRDSFLASYINGGSVYKDISVYMKLYNIEPRYEYFFVVSVIIKNYGVLEEAPKKDAAFVLNNILQDIADKDSCMYTNIDFMPTFIVNCRTESGEEKQEWINVFKRLRRLGKQLLEISFTAGISSVKKGFVQIPELYKEAQSAAEYASFYGVEEFAEYEAVHTDENGEVDTKRINELVMYIKSGDAEKAIDVINDIFSVDEKKGKWYYIGFMYNILNSMLVYARKKSEQIYDKIISGMKTITDNADLTEIKSFLCDMTYLVCDLAQTNEDSLCSRVKSYIDTNFTDPNLNAAAIGEKFNKGGFYVSKIFKDGTGQKLGDYIIDVRISNAKRLLLEDRDMKINDIAASCGYELARTFLKQFKEKEGITPTQYRKMNS